MCSEWGAGVGPEIALSGGTPYSRQAAFAAPILDEVGGKELLHEEGKDVHHKDLRFCRKPRNQKMANLCALIGAPASMTMHQITLELPRAKRRSSEAELPSAPSVQQRTDHASDS